MHEAEKLTYQLIFNCENEFTIYCYPDAVVLVNAPLGCSLNAIKNQVRKKAKFIVKCLRSYESFFPLRSSFKYINNEKHLYLGRSYRLTLYKGDLSTVRLQNGLIQVWVKKIQDVRCIRNLLDSWYLRMAKKNFKEKFVDASINCNVEHSINTAVRLNKIKRHTCNAHNRNFIFSAYLVQMPSKCIDYIIYHAICHMSFCDHGHAFYKALINFMPDYLNKSFEVKRS